MTDLQEIRRVKAEADLLFSEQQVEIAIARMAQAITEKLAESNPLLLCVVNGGIPIAAQLMLQCDFPMSNDIIYASRYQDRIVGEAVNWWATPQQPMLGRTVLIVDDILDEGLTLKAIHDYCTEQGAVRILSAVLVDKQIGKEKPVQADFVGLRADNRYLFGYGMDYKGYLRNARGIYASNAE